VALFLCLFASQAGVLVLSPVLVEIADDFGVSVATAGQLRSVTGLVAGAAALVLGRLAGRTPLRNLLMIGAAILAAASVLSAVAPAFWFLALVQIPAGVGLAVLLAAGVAGAGEWAPAEQRVHVLSWALVGQPAAWIVGMPLVGLVAEVSWRLAFVLPLAGSLLALFVLSLCSAGPPAARSTGSGALRLLRDRVVGAWALGELLAYSAWAGILVYAGALFIDSYDVSTTTAGVVLAAGAVAYVGGNMLTRRFVERSARAIHVALALASSGAALAFGAWRPALAVSAAVFATLGFLAGGRTLAGSTYGLDATPDRKLAVMSLRAAALQFGYLVGSAVGGIALAAAGYTALGAAFAVLFASATLPYLLARGRETTEAA
jgi:predicted MFS family arabinose efflux permease